MKVSLIMPTIHVYRELELFLESLLKQTYKNFELIIIDQNDTKEINIYNLVKRYKGYIDIKYKKSNKKGLSLNRNKGIFMMEGDIVGFPDDDCEYDVDTLEKVVNYFKKNEDKRLYSCRTLERNKDYGTGKMLENDAEISINNVEDTVKSITFFVNYQLEDIMLFDENLGVGSYYGSGEETDYVLRLLHKSFKGDYFANEIIYHPAKKGNYEDLERAYKYALGYGALIKKEVKERKNRRYIFKFIKKNIRSIGGMLITKNKAYHKTVLLGRIRGYKEYQISKR